MLPLFETRFGWFFEGEVVRYDIFRFGENVLGIAFKDRIETIDKNFVEYCKREGIVTHCEWDAAHDVRKEGEPCP